MEGKKLYLVGTHRDSFRAGEPAEVIGVEMIESDSEPDHCFKLRFEDGAESFTPIFQFFAAAPCGLAKNHHYELITEQEVRDGKLPEVRR